MVTFFCILAGIVFLQSLVSVRNGLAWLRFVRSYRPPSQDFLPPATVIVPCCGVEQGLADNLFAYLGQDYPSYEVVFVTGGEKDSATVVVRDVISGHSRGRLFFSMLGKEEGDKVTKLRLAVAQARAESQVLVFGDSDGRPNRQWLRHLVAPLADPMTGAATGYRWYLVGGRGPGFGDRVPTLLRAVWNSFIASLLGDHEGTFCWGGSTAVRRATFEAARVEEHWRGSVSDDYQLTNALRKAGLRIVFVPQCLVATFAPCGWRELFSWTTRQIIITRVYAPRLWALGLLANSVYTVTLMLGLALGFLGVPAALLLPPALLPGMVKGWVRALGAESMLPEHAVEFTRLRPAYALLAAVVPLLMFYNFVAAGLTRSIEWRGVHYELLGPNRTRVLTDESS